MMEPSAKSVNEGTRPRLLAIGTDGALMHALRQLACNDTFTLEMAWTLSAARDAIAHTVDFRSRRDVVLVEPFLHGEYVAELVPALRALPCAPAIGVVSAHLTLPLEVQLKTQGAHLCLRTPLATTELQWSVRALLRSRSLLLSLSFYEQAWQLSPRQTEVVLGALNGLTIKDVAAQLRVSPETVRTHWTRILEKSGKPCVAAVLVSLRTDEARRVDEQAQLTPPIVP